MPKVRFRKRSPQDSSRPRYARTPQSEAERALECLADFLQQVCDPSVFDRDLAALASLIADALDEVESGKATTEDAIAAFERAKMLGVSQDLAILTDYFNIVVIASLQAMKHYEDEEDTIAWTYAVDANYWAGTVTALATQLTGKNPLSDFATKGADARHAESRELKRRVRALYRERKYPTKDMAAEEIAIELDGKFRTFRKYLTGDDD